MMAAATTASSPSAPPPPWPCPFSPALGRSSPGSDGGPCARAVREHPQRGSPIVSIYLQLPLCSLPGTSLWVRREVREHPQTCCTRMHFCGGNAVPLQWGAARYTVREYTEIAQCTGGVSCSFSCPTTLPCTEGLHYDELDGWALLACFSCATRKQLTCSSDDRASRYTVSLLSSCDAWRLSATTAASGIPEGSQTPGFSWKTPPQALRAA